MIWWPLIAFAIATAFVCGLEAGVDYVLYKQAQREKLPPAVPEPKGNV